MFHIRRQVLIALPRVLGIDLSITNEVVLLWASALVTFAVLAAACRRRNPVPRGWFQNLFEALVEFIDNEVVRRNIGDKGAAWSPFLLALFFFILFANLIGILPPPTRIQAVTSNLNVTIGLALTVFAVTAAAKLRARGFSGFLTSFVPAGVPWWVVPLVVPIEIISWLAKPLSLAIRLFANMVAGHSLILIFIGMAMGMAWALRWLPLAGAVIMSGFELFVCFIQAFVFTMLTGIYLREAIESH